MAGSIAAVAIIAALAVGGFRLAIEALPEYESKVADRVREATGLRLSFDSLDARIGRYGPEIFFEGATIEAPDARDVLVSAEAGRASLSLLRSAWYRRLEIGRVVLERPRLNLVILPDRRIELVGQAGLTRPDRPPGAGRGLERVPRGTIEIVDATVAFVDLRTERGSWQLTDVDVELVRTGDRVALAGDVDLPRQLGESIRFALQVDGPLEDPSAVDWRASFEASDVDLAGWADLLPETFAVPSAGRGSFRLSAAGSGGGFNRGRAIVRLDDLSLPPVPGGLKPVVYRRLGGNLAVERIASGWRVTGSRVEFSLPGSAWTPTDLDASVVLDDGQITGGQVRAGFVRLENLAPLVALIPASPAREWMERLAPSGTLRRINVTASGIEPRRVPELRGSMEFEDVGFEPFGRVPGLRGVDGRIRAAGPDGVFELSTRGATMNWPEQWRKVADFPRIDAEVGWSRALEGVRISADKVVVSDGRATARGRLRLLARPGHTPLMDITARVAADDISHIAQYMPKSRLKPRPLKWLDEAFLGGRVVRGEVWITGPARGFPYREGQGRFRAVAEVKGAALRFSPGWQPLRELGAHLEFEGPSMRVTDAAGSIEGVRVAAADAEVLDWRQGILTIRAAAEGDAGDVHRFLAGSRLGPRLGETFARLSAQGPIEGDIVMYLPLKRFADRAITVQARALGVGLSLAGLDAPVEGLIGEAWFRNREVTAPSLSGRFMGGDAEAAISTVEGKDGTLLTSIQARGTMDAAMLPRIVRLPLESGLAGTAPWNGSLEVQRPPDPQGRPSSRVRIASTLAGVESGLPGPFGKRRDEALPLELDLEIEPSSVLARGRLGRDLRAVLQMRRARDGLRLSSGVVRLGGGETGPLPVEPGLRIEGRLPFLSISELTALRWSKPARVPVEKLLSRVDLEVGRLEVLGYEFDGVRGSMRPGNGAWNVAIASAAVLGDLQVPYRFPGEVPLVLDLDRLRAGARAPGKGREPDPRRLPAMRVDIRDLLFDQRALGHLSAEIARSDDGLTLEKLAVEKESFRAQGRGGWLVADGRQRSSLQLDIDIGDVRGFLEAMRLAPLIEGKKGGVRADLDWPGGPDATVLERVSGSVRVDLADGRILSVEPGAGRILGLMSIAHLPRRLSLDFDDLTGEGLAFDSIRGDFTLAAGEAYTDNLTLRGAAAEVGIAGRTSLKEKTYDQTAVVTGELGASLGVAGAIAGGPAVGAALLLFSQIFKEPLKGVARGYYRISGPWEDPLVRKIDARELEEAAGLGLPPSAPLPPAAPAEGAS